MQTPDQRRQYIDQLRTFPERLEAVVQPLTRDELLARPLTNEWSVAQNVHHLVDSHVNSYIRLKLILAEDYPTLRPYDQDVWASFPEASAAEIEESLTILRGLHRRWAKVFEHLSDHEWTRKGYHPENGDMTPDDILRFYVEHGDGHIEQIRRNLRALSAAGQ